MSSIWITGSVPFGEFDAAHSQIITPPARPYFNAPFRGCSRSTLMARLCDGAISLSKVGLSP